MPDIKAPSKSPCRRSHGHGDQEHGQVTGNGGAPHKGMTCKDGGTYAETDGLGKDKVDAQPFSKPKGGEEQGNDGVEHRREGKGCKDPLSVQSKLHSALLHEICLSRFHRTPLRGFTQSNSGNG
jgi:hypothetical protein